MNLIGIIGSFSISFFIFDQMMLALTFSYLSSFGTIFMGAFIIGGVFGIINSKKLVLDKNIRTLFTLLCIFIFISMMSVFNSQDMLSSVIKLLQFLFLTVWLLNVYIYREYICFNRTLRFSILLATVSILSVIFMRPDLLFSAESSSKRLIFEGLGINAISMSVGYLIILSCLFIFRKGTNRVDRVLVSFFLILAVFFVIKSGTRSVVVGVPTALLFSYIIVYKGAVSFRQISILTITFLTTVIVAIKSGLIGDKIIDRVLIGSSDFQENSRVEIWNKAFEWYGDNLLGTGFGSELEAFKYMVAGEAHNTFISVLIQTSMIGLLFYCLVFFQIIKFVASKKISSIVSFITWSLFIFLVMQMLKGSLQNTRLFFIPIAWIFIISSYPVLKNKTK